MAGSSFGVMNEISRTECFWPVLYIIVHVLFRDDLLGIPAAGDVPHPGPAFFAVIFLYFFGSKCSSAIIPISFEKIPR